MWSRLSFENATDGNPRNKGTPSETLGSWQQPGESSPQCYRREELISYWGTKWSQNSSLVGIKNPKPLKERQQSYGRKNPLLPGDEQKSNPSDCGRRAVHTPATKTKIHGFRKRGREKAFCSVEGGKPTGPRTHANTKPPFATTGGRTRSSLSPKTIHRPRLRVWPHWEEGKGTLGVLLPRHRSLGPVQYSGQTMKT